MQAEDSIPSSPTPTERVEAQGEFIERQTAGVALCACLSKIYGQRVLPEAFQRAMQRQLADCGGPRDAVERMMLEQLVLVDGVIKALCIDYGVATHGIEKREYVAVMAKLTGEFRRSAMALRDYRNSARDRLRVVVDDSPRDDTQRGTKIDAQAM